MTKRTSTKDRRVGLYAQILVPFACIGLASFTLTIAIAMWPTSTHQNGLGLALIFGFILMPCAFSLSPKDTVWYRVSICLWFVVIIFAHYSEAAGIASSIAFGAVVFSVMIVMVSRWTRLSASGLDE